MVYIGAFGHVLSVAADVEKGEISICNSLLRKSLSWYVSYHVALLVFANTYIHSKETEFPEGKKDQRSKNLRSLQKPQFFRFWDIFTI